MKVCQSCYSEIHTKDGVNRCKQCRKLKADERRRVAKAQREAMESIGLVRVRGALGGVYYE